MGSCARSNHYFGPNLRVGCCKGDTGVHRRNASHSDVGQSFGGHREACDPTLIFARVKAFLLKYLLTLQSPNVSHAFSGDLALRNSRLSVGIRKRRNGMPHDKHDPPSFLPSSQRQEECNCGEDVISLISVSRECYKRQGKPETALVPAWGFTGLGSKFSG